MHCLSKEDAVMLQYAYNVFALLGSLHMLEDALHGKG